ncbi:LysM peptidoglycan-binding domain-containing protein [Fredinandcohnia sp. 179-A 10B2 NHS]|uniref:LysM peptidoglycan-binding domain-containing protein n=1 Tax=Fredinandcohnia sp. 179-A 10B2 NHS TaxID=3235176 RepID=UPI00399FBE5C
MKRLLVLVFCLLLCISSVSPSVYANESNVHVVKAGDTLPDLAKQFETSVEEIKLSNGLQSDLLVVGQKILIPFSYEVKAGEEMKDIALRFHSSVEEIKKANGLQSEELYVGQNITVPPRKYKMDGHHILMTKDEFKDWIINNKFKRKISLIQQHHTWIPSYSRFNGSNHFLLLKGMENFHIQKMGWNQIAQNITTFPDGKIAVSRPINIAPEGTIGAQANAVGIAIENLGNFDEGCDEMTKEQKDTIVYLTALLCLKFGLTPSVDSITYHHWWNVKTGERVLDKGPDYNVKTCPGTGFFGGNSTDSAKKYFYPLVTQKMKEMKASFE